MNETEKKMLDYLQSLVDAMKKERLSADYKESEVTRESVAMTMKAFEHCAAMFADVTGRRVTFKNWQVTLADK